MITPKRFDRTTCRRRVEIIGQCQQRKRVARKQLGAVATKKSKNNGWTLAAAARAGRVGSEAGRKHILAAADSEIGFENFGARKVAISVDWTELLGGGGSGQGRRGWGWGIGRYNCADITTRKKFHHPQEEKELLTSQFISKATERSMILFLHIANLEQEDKTVSNNNTFSFSFNEKVSDYFEIYPFASFNLLQLDGEIS